MREFPYLMNIPILGHLFRHKGESEKFEDVLIFITPYILDKEQVADMDLIDPEAEAGPDSSQGNKWSNGILQDPKSY